jgi:hypothetical protein
MGGQQFPAMDPESFLFGDLMDLNFLARIPGEVCMCVLCVCVCLYLCVCVCVCVCVEN